MRSIDHWAKVLQDCIQKTLKEEPAEWTSNAQQQCLQVRVPVGNKMENVRPDPDTLEIVKNWD